MAAVTSPLSSPPHNLPPDSSPPLSSVDPATLKVARSRVETYAEKNLPSDRTSKILFAFLDHLLPDGQQAIAEDIINSTDLCTLADHYFTAVLLHIRASGGKTPSAIPTARCDNFTVVDDISDELTDQKRNQAKLKAECLPRDNNRCLLTGFYDLKTAMEHLSEQARQNVITAPTEAAHIIPFSLASFAEPERHAKSLAWEAIYHAFPIVTSLPMILTTFAMR